MCFSLFPLFEGVFLSSFLLCDKEDHSNLILRNFDIAGYLVLEWSWFIDQGGSSDTEEVYSSSLLNAD